MSRRPAIKILPPLLLGVYLGSCLPICLPWTILLGSNVLLLLLSIALSRHAPPLVIDSVLMVTLLVSGALAFSGEKVRGKSLETDTATEATVLAEICGFYEPLGKTRGRVEGCLRYIAREETFQADGRMAMIVLDATEAEPEPGMIIVAKGRLSGPDRRKNPGGVSQAEIFEQRGLTWYFRAGKDNWNILGDGGPEALDPSVGSRLRGKIGRRIDAIFRGEHVGFMKGILLGSRGQIRRERRSQFSKAGVYHILAISGLHVGIICGLCFLLLDILRVPSLPRILLILVILLIYGFLAGMKPSIQRAIAMVMSIIIATEMSRKIDILNLLYVLIAGLVFLSPGMLWNTGFQMSFLATWGILALYPAFHGFIGHLQSRYFLIIRYGVQIAIISLCAQAPLIPVITSSFHSVPLVSPIVNMIVLPIISVLIPAGLITLIASSFGSLLTVLSVPSSAVTSLLIEILFKTVEFFSGHPATLMTVPSFGIIGIISYYLILFLASRCLEGRMRRETFLIVLLLSGTIHADLALLSQGGSLRVTFLDVGQGDSAVFEFPTGEIMIIDGGPTRWRWDAGLAVIEPFLLDRRVDRVDFLAFSHPQLDHIGGLPGLMDRHQVGVLLDPGQPNSLDSYITILDTSIEKGVSVCWPRRGDSLSIGNAEVRILHPTSEWISEFPDQESVNDACLVLKLTFDGVSFLMTGDIGVRVEGELVDEMGGELDADVLKVPHHGSSSSMTVPFLESVDPRVAVISVGRDNPFGHPTPFVLEQIRKRGIGLYRTDIDGALVFIVEKGAFEVHDGSGRFLDRCIPLTVPVRKIGKGEGH